MKKLSAVFLAFILLCSSASPAESVPDSPAAAVLGDWYAGFSGVPLHLVLNGDGTYELLLPAAFGESLSGTWEADDIFISLDGSELALISSDLLVWRENDLTFTRNVPLTYTPAEIFADAPQEAYEGYWKCFCVDSDGFAVPAAAIGETTDLYMEGTMAALGGPRFGDVFQSFTFDGGVYTADFSGRTLTLAFQADGFLRLSIAGEDSETVLYMMSAHYPAPGEKAE